MYSLGIHFDVSSKAVQEGIKIDPLAATVLQHPEKVIEYKEQVEIVLHLNRLHVRRMK